MISSTASIFEPPARGAKGGGPRILIVAPSWIGDTLMMQPLLMRLRQQSPDAEIHVLAPAWCAPLLKRMPEVGGVIENPFAHGEFNLAARRALGRELAATGYSAAYVLPNSWKSALVPYFAGIPRRIGFRGEARYVLLNRRPALDKAALPRLVDRYCLLAGASTGPTPQPHLTSTTEQQHATLAAFGLPGDARPVIFCPGAEFGPAKRWPARHFARLAELLAAKVGAGDTPGLRGTINRDTPGLRGTINRDTPILRGTAIPDTPILILGSTKDAAVGAEIVRLTNGATINLCGRTSLEQAIDLIAAAHSVVSNDSGLMHVAAALDRPMVALYGSSSPAYTPPLSPRATILSLGLACSPCFKRQCPLAPPQHMRCLDDLDPARVLTELEAHRNA